MLRFNFATITTTTEKRFRVNEYTIFQYFSRNQSELTISSPKGEGGCYREQCRAVSLLTKICLLNSTKMSSLYFSSFDD